MSKETGIKTGDEITVTATPIAGYKVASIKVTQYGEEKDITKDGKFVAAAVNKVAVEFVSDSTPVAQSYTLDLVKCTAKSVSGQTTTYENVWTATSNNLEYTVTNGNKQSDAVRFGSNRKALTSSIVNNVAFTNKIGSIDIQISQINAADLKSAQLLVSTDNTFATVAETIDLTISAKGKVSVKIGTPTAGCFYKLVLDMQKTSSNGTLRITSITYNEVL